ncbi:preprotein translocase subunit YajC [Actinomyces minihominis]|uniref:preprotein translocase subunit YajC n=1 Tax=Actinomyces minihominis TaxID=2002838 RepID=UPI000C074A5A|nr:preprotein translocase subunit YajC [Actinomyces minihominis]
MGPELLLFMGVLVVGMFVMNSFAKKSQKKRQDEQERTMREQMVPGAWVQTYSGFFGRFVDIDGDVVILETPSGEETYWLRAAVRAVTDPPFEQIADPAEEDHTVDLDSTDHDIIDQTDEGDQDSTEEPKN